MGSNQNRHGDKKIALEWGSKARKEENPKIRAHEKRVIEEGEVEGHPVHGGKRRKKDTKRWCRGKVGKEHDWQPFNKYPGLSRIWRKFGFEKCGTCGKERICR